MMLFKLSFKNIIKSIKDYAIYFFTLTLGVGIFYVFNALDSQTAMLNLNASTKMIAKTLVSILSGVSIFVSIILAFLIIYASRFLIKRRNKEFGIYLTLGMSKRKISIILFLETLFIGIISLVVGLGIGVVLSQFMSVLVAKMFEADMTNFAFVFSKQALIKTIICFSIMYLIVMIFNTTIIGKSKLIDLIYGNKKNEKVKIKNPYMCIIIFILATFTLGYAYYMVTDGIEILFDNENNIFIPIMLGIVSTFFIFWSVSGLLLKIFTNIKHIYYRKLNSFTIRQISSKINTMVASVSIICLMLFVTICALSASLSLKNTMNEMVKKLAPVDVDLYKLYYNRDVLKPLNLTKEEIKNRNSSVKDSLEGLGIDVNSFFKDMVEYNSYQIDGITFEYTLGDKRDEILKDYPYLGTDSLEEIMKISEYNKVARLFNNEEFELNDDEYLIVGNYQNMVAIRNRALKYSPEIIIEGHKLKPKYQEVKDGFVVMSPNYMNIGIIIVPDNVIGDIYNKDYTIKDEYRIYNHLLANYNSNNIDSENIFGNYSNKNGYILPSYDTKIEISSSSIGLGAMVTFISIYLGIIFLMASAAILALKELTESSDNKERYNILRRLGADEKMINRALFDQILIFFLLPLLLAIIHSIFGIKFCDYVLFMLGSESLLKSIIMTAVFIVFIYGGYFLITYLCSKNIIRR